MKNFKRLAAAFTAAAVFLTSCGADTGEPEIDYTDERGRVFYKNPTLWTTEEIFEKLTINGKTYDYPLTLEKLGEGYALSDYGSFYDSENRSSCKMLTYNDKHVGYVYFEDCESLDDTDGKNITEILFVITETDEEFADNSGFGGITVNSSLEDVYEIAGTPTYSLSDGIYLVYTHDPSAEDDLAFVENEYNGAPTIIMYIDLE